MVVGALETVQQRMSASRGTIEGTGLGSGSDRHRPLSSGIFDDGTGLATGGKQLQAARD